MKFVQYGGNLWLFFNEDRKTSIGRFTAGARAASQATNKRDTYKGVSWLVG